MAYCKKIESDEKSGRYKFGNNEGNMTGEVIFTSEPNLRVIKAPDNEKTNMLFLGKLFYKESNDFRKGIFKDKIAYES